MHTTPCALYSCNMYDAPDPPVKACDTAVIGFCVILARVILPRVLHHEVSVLYKTWRGIQAHASYYTRTPR